MSKSKAVAVLFLLTTLVACASAWVDSDPGQCVEGCEARYRQCVDRQETPATTEREQYCETQRQNCVSFCPVGDGPPRY